MQTCRRFGAVDAIGGGEEFEILDDLHVVIDAEEIGHVADEAADFLRVAIDRVAADVRLAVSRIEQRRQDLHRGRLARAVGADEAKQIPRGQIELDGLDGELLAVFLRQVVGRDHGAGGSSGLGVRDSGLRFTGRMMRNQVQCVLCYWLTGGILTQ